MKFGINILRVPALAIIALLFAAPATAASVERNIDNFGIAVAGYDPVAYFEIGKPVKGSASHALEHDDATYHFVNKKHRDLFSENPEKYTPAYGGWCSFGMRYDQKSRVDPHSWDIVDGKLYLTLNGGTRAVWRQKIAENISVADKLWKKIFVKN
ncbi:MAG: YHS domain-containing (seleno)protein [Alphaproteobacteria bacterium]